eukprot:556556-Hanusia_phi.AAC.7
MSRHRNIGGWVAEAEEEFDDDYYLEHDDARLFEVGTRVMARFYDENEVSSSRSCGTMSVSWKNPVVSGLYRWEDKR